MITGMLDRLTLAVLVVFGTACGDLPSVGEVPTVLDLAIQGPDSISVGDTTMLRIVATDPEGRVLLEPPLDVEVRGPLEVVRRDGQDLWVTAGRSGYPSVGLKVNRPQFEAPDYYRFFYVVWWPMHVLFDSESLEFTYLDQTLEVRARAETDDGRPVPEGRLTIEPENPAFVSVDVVPDGESARISVRAVEPGNESLFLGHSRCASCRDRLFVQVQQEPTSIDARDTTATWIGQLVILRAEVRDYGGAAIPMHADWQLANPADSTVAHVGLRSARALGKGEATLVATIETDAGALTDTATLVVDPRITTASVEGLPRVVQELGHRDTVHVTGVDAGGTPVDDFHSSEWLSSDENVLTIRTLAPDTAEVTTAGYGRARVVARVLPCASGCVEVEASASMDVTQRIDSVRVSPAHDTLNYLSAEGQLLATVYGEQDVIPDAPIVWSVLDSGVVALGSAGRIAALAVGEARVEARIDSLADTAVVVVRQVVAAIQVPLPPALVVDASYPLTGTPVDSGGAPIPGVEPVWSTSDASVLDVSAGGALTGRAEGVATITASAGGRASSFEGLAVEPGYRLGETNGTVCIVSITGRAYCGLGRLRELPIPDVARISEGSGSLCVEQTDGGLLCLGKNRYGQLGTGDREDKYIPTPIATSVALSSLAIVGTASPYYSHSCGLGPDGRAYCWGDPFSGQLGYPKTYDSQVFPSPVPIESELTFESIVVGMGHTCAVGAEGTYCWGKYEPFDGGPEPSLIVGTETVESVTAGSEFSCGVTPVGDGLCWGNDEDGQLGNGTDGSSLAATAVDGGHSFVEIDAGGRHACGLATDGLLWCWGRNREAQLGDGTDIDRPAPVLAAGGALFDGVIAGGAAFTAARTLDGSLWLWGSPLGRDSGGFSKRVLIQGAP